MEWRIFEEWLNIRLYQQMKDLIYVVCTKEDKYARNRENNEYELFSGSTDKTIEEEYGLHYPGEVLERLHERREVKEKESRALGLALAVQKNLLEDTMFIGSQLPVFWKRMQEGLQENDIFLLVIRYLMEEKKKKECYEKLIGYPYRNISELLLVLSILPKDQRIWDAVKLKLNAALGTQREFSVYGNERIYTWLAQKFQFRVKGYRKKDIDAIKYLLRMPFQNAYGSSGLVAEKLSEYGYTEGEVRFLNYRMIQEVHLPEVVDTRSITAEKIAVEICRYFLDAEKEYPDEVYELCSQLCAFYQSFHVRINGKEGIMDVLTDVVQVKHVKSFQIAFPYLTGKCPVNKWSKFDLTDSRWDALYSSLSKKDYDTCVTEIFTTETDAAKLKEGLKHYQELTDEDYTQRFWDNSVYHRKAVFDHLSDYGVLPVKCYMEQFISEYRQNPEVMKEKWKNLMWYLQHYIVGIPSHEAYSMLKIFVDEMGMTEVEGLFSVKEVLLSCFVCDGGYRRSRKMDLFRPFMEAEEHQELFSWIEEYIFQNYTEQYADFLIHVLSNQENLLWFPKEEARAVYLMLQEKLDDTDRLSGLRKFYLTEEEQQMLQKRENYLEERRVLKRQMEEEKELKCAFTKMIAESRLMEGQFQQIERFIFQCSYRMAKEAERITASYLQAFVRKERVYLYGKHDLQELFSLLAMLYKKGVLGLETVKNFISKVEVAE